MKLIDKYLLRSYLVPLGYCLAAFCMIYVVSHLFGHLSTFMEAGTPLRRIVIFYLAFLPSVNGPCSFLLLIVPVSLLVSSLYSLAQLTRHNELTAIRASGVSLWRIMWPYLAVGFVCAVSTGLIQEFVTPWASYWTTEFLRTTKTGGTSRRPTVRPLMYVNVKADRVWFVEEFDTQAPRRLRGVKVRQTYADGSVEEIHGEEAEWLDGRWWFFGVTSRRESGQGVPIPRWDAEGKPLPVQTPRQERREMGRFTETPRDFMSEVKEPEYLSALELRRYVRRHARLDAQDVASLMVDVHLRLAMPWTCLLVTLLGFPTGSRTGRQGAFAGILSALALFFAYYVLVYVGVGLGKGQYIPPWFSAWCPNIVFFFVGVTMVCRMR